MPGIIMTCVLMLSIVMPIAVILSVVLLNVVSSEGASIFNSAQSYELLSLEK
jgi:hypothetical protein